MFEYQVTVYVPGGAIYLRTEWQPDATKAEGIALELASLYGHEVVELVEREQTRTGYSFDTLLHAEVWRG